MPSMPMPMPMPSNAPTTVNPTMPGAEAAAPKTIVEIASEAGTFKTLVAALKAADLVETLSGPGPFTVFAPTDEAFAALPKGTVEKLLLPKNKAVLAKILTYHVVSGAAESNMLKAGTIKTVEGSSVMVKTMMGHVMVDGAMVTTADIKASNGIIHVINKVLLPADVKL